MCIIVISVTKWKLRLLLAICFLQTHGVKFCRGRSGFWGKLYTCSSVHAPWFRFQSIPKNFVDKTRLTAEWKPPRLFVKCEMNGNNAQRTACAYLVSAMLYDSEMWSYYINVISKKKPLRSYRFKSVQALNHVEPSFIKNVIFQGRGLFMNVDYEISVDKRELDVEWAISYRKAAKKMLIRKHNSIQASKYTLVS